MVLICAVLVSGAASAQIVNPNAVVFNHTDYASASRYDGGYFALPILANNTCDLQAQPASSPVTIDNLGKPTSATGVGITASLVAKPIGCYVYKVRALDISGLYSDWSAPSDPFERRPASPSNLVVK
jgi:hypothetical protein